MGVAPPGLAAVRRRARRRWGLAVSVVALVLVLVATGNYYFPSHGPSRARFSPGPGAVTDPTNATFLEDLVVARAFAVNRSGGPWTLVGGAGVESPGRLVVPLAASGAFPCPVVPEPYASRAAFAFPGSGAVDGGGTAPGWTYDFVGPSGNGLRVAVVDGTASEIGRLAFDGPGCPVAERPSLNASGGLDSDAVALAALGLGGTGFLGEYPGGSVSYRLGPGPEPGAPGGLAVEWNVTYDACGAPMAPGAATLGAALTLLFDARNGTLEADRASSFACPLGAEAPLPYDLPQVLALNAPVLAVAGGVAYFNATVAAVCCGLTFANLSIALETGGVGTPPGAALVAYGLDGALLCGLDAAELSGGNGTSCAAPVQSGELLSLQLPASGAPPPELALNGIWHFQGTVQLALANATLVSTA